MGLLSETSATNRNFIFKLYNIEKDDNTGLDNVQIGGVWYKIPIGYRPIEVMDVGVDKKTMIPKPLIYPDYFTYYPVQALDDYNVLEGNEMFTNWSVDGNIDPNSSVVINDDI